MDHSEEIDEDGNIYEIEMEYIEKNEEDFSKEEKEEEDWNWWNYSKKELATTHLKQGMLPKLKNSFRDVPFFIAQLSGF